MAGGSCLQDLCQPEGHELRHRQLAAALKDDVEVDVNHLGCGAIQQNVAQVAITETQQVSHLCSR